MNGKTLVYQWRKSLFGDAKKCVNNRCSRNVDDGAVVGKNEVTMLILEKKGSSIDMTHEFR